MNVKLLVMVTAARVGGELLVVIPPDDLNELKAKSSLNEQGAFSVFIAQPRCTQNRSKDTSEQCLNNEQLSHTLWLTRVNANNNTYLIKIFLPHGLSAVSDKFIPAMDQPALRHGELGEPLL